MRFSCARVLPMANRIYPNRPLSLYFVDYESVTDSEQPPFTKAATPYTFRGTGWFAQMRHQVSGLKPAVRRYIKSAQHLIVIMVHLGQADTLSREPGASFECRNKATTGLTEPKDGSALSGRQCLPPRVVGVPLLSLLFTPIERCSRWGLFCPTSPKLLS